MKTESEITYIFIRYVTVTLKTTSKYFLQKQRTHFFSNELQLLIDSHEITKQFLLNQANTYTPDIILEKQLVK